METRICPLCGHPHPAGARFCPATGQPIPEPPTLCPECGQNLRPDWIACPNCGTRLQGPLPYPQPSYTLAQPRPRRRARWLLVPGFLLLLVLVVAAALYLFLGLHRVNQIAKVVPADTRAVLSINPSLPQMLRLYQERDALSDTFSIFAVLADLLDLNFSTAGSDLPAGMLDNTLADLNIDLQHEILTWVGPEISLAVLNEERYGSLPAGSSAHLAKPASAFYNTTPVMLAVATRNQKASADFLNRLRGQLERQGAEFQTWNYQDIPITEVVSGSDLPLAYAVYQHLVVVATHADIIVDSIDSAQGKDRAVLANQENYHQALDVLPANRLGYLYLDWPNTIGGFGFNVLSTTKNFGLALILEQSGLRFDYAFQYNLGLLTPQQVQALRQPAHADRLRQIVPADSLFYVSGMNVTQGWQSSLTSEMGSAIQDVQAQLMWELGMPTDNSQVDLEAEIEWQTGVNFQNDLLAKMKGDYALVLAPDPDGLFGEEDIPFGLLFYVRVDDLENFQVDFNRVLQMMADGSGLDLYQERTNNIDTVYLEDSYGNMTLGYGFIQDVLFVGTSANMLELAARGPSQPLAANPIFQAAMDPLPEDRGSYYFDVAEIMRMYYNLLSEGERQDFNQNVRPYVDSIQSIGVSTGELKKQDWLYGSVFINTKGYSYDY